MADGDILGFSEEDIRRIADAVAFIEHDPRYIQTRRSASRNMPMTNRHFGKLTSNLSAGSFASPSSATVNVYIPDPTSTSATPPLIITTNSNLLGITVANYDPSLSGDTGYFCKIESGPGGWSFYDLGCAVA